jgi:MarR-like DNA-binding transcriptional regulator SgrR of sgrS sRNA
MIIYYNGNGRGLCSDLNFLVNTEQLSETKNNNTKKNMHADNVLLRPERANTIKLESGIELKMQNY